MRSANLEDDFDFHKNPEYSPDSSLYMREEFCALGFEIFQDNYGTILDNILITDDVEYAKNAASNVNTTQEGEKKAKDAQDELSRKKTEKSGRFSFITFAYDDSNVSRLFFLHIRHCG